MKFTLVFSSEQVLLLDTILEIKNKRFSTELYHVYTQPTDALLYLRLDSSHTCHMFSSIMLPTVKLSESDRSALTDVSTNDQTIFKNVDIGKISLNPRPNKAGTTTSRSPDLQQVEEDRR